MPTIRGSGAIDGQASPGGQGWVIVSHTAPRNAPAHHTFDRLGASITCMIAPARDGDTVAAALDWHLPRARVPAVIRYVRRMAPSCPIATASRNLTAK